MIAMKKKKKKTLFDGTRREIAKLTVALTFVNRGSKPAVDRSAEPSRETRRL
jgi:hypothetical protein